MPFLHTNRIHVNHCRSHCPPLPSSCCSHRSGPFSHPVSLLLPGLVSFLFLFFCFCPLLPGFYKYLFIHKGSSLLVFLRQGLVKLHWPLTCCVTQDDLQALLFNLHLWGLLEVCTTVVLCLCASGDQAHSFMHPGQALYQPGYISKLGNL